MATLPFQPRFIRVTDAPKYLAVSKTLFAREFRPYLIVIKLGEHAKARARAYDRLDLDAIANEYKSRMGSVPPKHLGANYGSTQPNRPL